MSGDSPLLPSKTELSLRPTWFARTFSRMAPGSLRASILTLSSGAIGAGLLSLPLAMEKCGLILGILFLGASAISFDFYYRVIIAAMEQTGAHDFMKLLDFFYGEFWRKVGEVSALIILIGSLCVYQALIVQLWLDVVQAFGLEYDGYYYYLFNGIAVFIISLLSIPKTLTSLRYVAGGCIVSVIYMMLVVIVQSPSAIASTENIGEKIKYLNIDLDSLNSVTIIIYAYNTILTLPIVYAELKSRSIKRAGKIIDRSITLMVVIYGLIAVIGYLSLIEDVPELFINRTKDSEPVDWPMIAGKAFYGVTLLASYTMTLNPLRKATETFFVGISSAESPLRFYVINFSLILLVSMISIFFPRIVSYFQFLGGFPVVYIAIIVPTLIYMKLGKRLLFRVVVALWGLFLSVIGLSSALLTVTNI